MNAPDKSSLPAADRKVEGQRKGGRRSQGPNPSTQAAAQHSTGKSTIEKCTASRPVLPLRRNTSQIKSPSCVKPSSPIAIENILADLHKLRPVTADNQSSFLLNPAKSTPVAQSIRSVHRSGDKTGDETGDGGLKKVAFSLGTPLFKPIQKMPKSDNQNQDRERRVTLEQHSVPKSSRRMDHNAANNAEDLHGSGNLINHGTSESVVPGLMEVYDALTQSSTPQPGGMYAPETFEQIMGYYDGQQVSNQPPTLPPVSHLGSSQNSYRSRPLKPGKSSEDSELSGYKRKPSNEVAKSSRRKKVKDETKKKSTTNDSRWSKRFTWPDELHRDFVAAVFEVGLKHSSPSAIMEHMKQNPNVTSERVKSHLQKYRLNRQKSRNEFMNSYDRSLQGFKNNHHDLDEDGDHSYNCGEVAALLTHSVQTESRDCSHSQSSKSTNRGVEQPPSQAGPSGVVPDGVPVLHLPLLSEEESLSPLGQTFGYLVGIFQTLSMELEMKRKSQDDNQTLAQNKIIRHHSAQCYPQSPEETAATAASINIADPSIYEVANAVPHVIATRAERMHRVQTQSIQYKQYDMIGDSSKTSFPYHQGMELTDQERRGYAHDQSPSNHISSNHEVDGSLPTQHQSTSTKPSLVPCPLDSSGCPSNNAPGGHGTGRTLQAQKESSIMKQDMKSQKVFQNKMRALKQVELNKYGGERNRSSNTFPHHAEEFQESSCHRPGGGGEDEATNLEDGQHSDSNPLDNPEGLDHDFWNSGDVTDQLFNFLMDS